MEVCGGADTEGFEDGVMVSGEEVDDADGDGIHDEEVFKYGADA